MCHRCEQDNNNDQNENWCMHQQTIILKLTAAFALN